MADIKKQQELAAELSSKLWAMANDLRGNMEAYEFKNYILGLLFYKELSDRTEKFVAELLQEDNTTFEVAWNDPEYKEAIVDEMLIKLGYVLEPKYLFTKMLELIRKDEFSIDYFEEAINSIIASTQGQDSEADFDGLFEDMDLKSSKLGKEIKQRSKLIGKVLQTIDSIEVDLGDTDVDVLGTAYVTLIGLFAQTAGKKGGEFYTPTNMSKLVARLATVGLTKVLNVADCACGSGSLLLQVGQYVDVSKYYGQELTSTTYNLARMNMILHGIDYKNFNIINVDTLEDDTTFADETFMVQVANPPYSANWSADSRFMDDDRFSPYGKLAPKSKADFAFVQHMIYHMANGDSRISVLLPHGVLSRTGSEETIRKYIVKDLNLIDAIVGLPINCFQGTGTPVCCIVLKKERGENSNNICFIDASQHYTHGQALNHITDDDIEEIVKAYTERKDVDKFCHVADMSEIIANGYDLNIASYIDSFDIGTGKTLESAIAEIYNDRENLDSTNEDYNSVYEELGLELDYVPDTISFAKSGKNFPEWTDVPLGDILEEVTIKTTVEDEYELLSSAIEGVFLNSELFSHQRGSSNIGYKVVKRNQAILSTQNLHLGNVNVNTRFDIGMVSPAYKIYNLVNCNPIYMSYFIKTEAMKKVLYSATTPGASACRRNVDWKKLYTLTIKMPSIEEQDEIARVLQLFQDRIKYHESIFTNLKYGLLKEYEE